MENWPVIAVRFALYADLMVLAGLTAFSFYALTATERASNVLPLTTPAVVLSVAGFLLSGFGMLAMVAAMTGTSLLVIDGATLREVIGETAIGTAWIVRMAAMTGAVVASLLLMRFASLSRLVLVASTSLAIATLVWTGHAGATEGSIGTVHRISDIVHMLAAAVWIGGIAAFIMLLFRPAAHTSETLSLARRALEQFSRVGTLAVGLIVATGILNGVILLGLPDFGSLIGSPYGRLLLAKLGLFGVMLMMAAVNRWRLTPALGAAAGNREAASVRNLKRSLALEGLAALAILALVAWLGTLEPLGAAI
jgi:copper resistance protein D